MKKIHTVKNPPDEDGRSTLVDPRVYRGGEEETKSTKSNEDEADRKGFGDLQVLNETGRKHPSEYLQSGAQADPPKAYSRKHARSTVVEHAEEGWRRWTCQRHSNHNPQRRV